MSEIKFRIAVPYTERLFTSLHRVLFGSLVQALWDTVDDKCEVLKLHESELLSRDDYDGVFLMRNTGTNLLMRNKSSSEPFLEHFRKTGKRIAIWRDDLHWFCWRVPYPPKRLVRIFDQVDLIFVTYFHQFCQWRSYRRFRDKVIWSPWSVPDWIFEYSRPWETRNNRILVSGRCGRSYPLRRRLFKYAWNCGQDTVDALEHPGYGTNSEKRGLTGKDFYTLLGSYKGAVATTASTSIPRGRKINYTVAKYIEIPACGCMPFMEETPDLGELGFREGEHYVSINRWNYKNRFGAIYSAEAEGIIKAAQELIRKRHTHSHRVNTMLNEVTRRFS